MARILVADDNTGVREGWKKRLTQKGHIVETVADGDAALKALESGETFDRIITDFEMGSGPNGLEVAQAAVRKGIAEVYINTSNPAKLREIPQGVTLMRTQNQHLNATRPDNENLKDEETY